MRKNQTQVFYDGACPLCSKEISFYKTCQGAENVTWTDIHSEQFNNAITNDSTFNKEQALAKLHIRRADGQLIKGAAAFAYLWCELKRFSWLGKLFLLPPFSWLLTCLYSLFLGIRRFTKNKQ